LEEYITAAMQNIILKYLGNTACNEQTKSAWFIFYIKVDIFNRANIGSRSIMQKDYELIVLVVIMNIYIWAQNY